MKHYNKGDELFFAAQRPCRLAGRRFRTGDMVVVRLTTDWGEDEGLGGGGPWGWGGYTAATLRGIAALIEDAGSGTELHSRLRAIDN